MQYWWVNQNQTYEFEVSGNCMWSPKTSANEARNQFYDNMAETKPGDVVFSFKSTLIKAVGVVTGQAETAAEPTEFSTVENPWGKEGWHVPVAFTELKNPIRPKDHITELLPTLPEKYSPLQANGSGLQSVYLANVPADMATVLITLLSGQVEAIVDGADQRVYDEADDDNAEAKLTDRKDIPETEKLQLQKSRRGQGLFRTRVQLIEKMRRVTGLSDKRHLRASHIKPWVRSNDHEKLDGNNGLLLSPHIDHLFDRGYISFASDGSLMLSAWMKSDVLLAWGLDPHLNVGAFGAEQELYLQYHRTDVFK
jgi:hypothetical protein